MIRVSLWTAAFLILLRVCIGWHFFFEGLTKVKSAYQGKAATNEKPFSSEAYFRESEGPFGKVIQKLMGDPDQSVIDRLTPRPVEGDASTVPPGARFPAALEAEWDEYYARFVAQFKLDEDRQKEAKAKLDQAKASYVNWLNGQSDAIDPVTKKAKEIRLTVKRKAPSGSPSGDFEEDVTIPERIAELRKRSAAVREAYDQKLPLLGKDVEGPNLRTMKADAAAVRADLQKEIDAQTTKMKDTLARLLGTRTSAYAVPEPKDVPAAVRAMLVPMAGGANPLARTWDEYADFVKDVAPGWTDEQRAALGEAKVRFDRWLEDKDPYTGTPLADKPMAAWRTALADAERRAAVAGPVVKGFPATPPTTWQARATRELYATAHTDAVGEIDTLHGRVLSDIKAQSDAMRALVGVSLVGDDRAKGYAVVGDERYLWVVPKSWGAVDFLDWSTRWFLAVVGVLLMAGLFTRLSCFSAAGFLLLTVLTQPSLPWLPTPPNQEGTYLFVNKNVIEMVALLALMGARTGRWAGLDGLLGWAFGRKGGRA